MWPLKIILLWVKSHFPAFLPRLVSFPVLSSVSYSSGFGFLLLRFGLFWCQPRRERLDLVWRLRSVMWITGDRWVPVWTHRSIRKRGACQGAGCPKGSRQRAFKVMSGGTLERGKEQSRWDLPGCKLCLSRIWMLSVNVYFLLCSSLDCKPSSELLT